MMKKIMVAVAVMMLGATAVWAADDSVSAEPTEKTRGSKTGGSKTGGSKTGGSKTGIKVDNAPKTGFKEVDNVINAHNEKRNSYKKIGEHKENDTTAVDDTTRRNDSAFDKKNR